MGMIKERIRTEEQNQRHRALVQENRKQKLKKYQQQHEEMRSVCNQQFSIKKKLYKPNNYFNRELLKNVIIKEPVQHHIYFQIVI